MSQGGNPVFECVNSCKKSSSSSGDSDDDSSSKKSGDDDDDKDGGDNNNLGDNVSCLNTKNMRVLNPGIIFPNLSDLNAGCNSTFISEKGIP